MLVKQLLPLLVLVAFPPFATHGALIPLGEESQRSNTNGLIYIGSLSNPAPRDGGGAYANSVYYASPNDANWEDAMEDCTAFLGESATLLYLETQEEMANFTDWLETHPGTGSSYWVGGLYNISKESFEWTNGVSFPAWIPWDEDQPNSTLPDIRVEFRRVNSRFATEYGTNLTRYLCEVKVGGEAGEDPEPCYVDNDLIILLDSSDNITDDNYLAALEFTTELAVAWADHPGNRLSVIVYSDQYSIVTNLTHQLSAAQLRDLIYGIAYTGGETLTDMALNVTLTEFQENARNVTQNLVVLTDGFSKFPNQTIEVAGQIAEAGIRGFAVGIGQNANAEELLAIAGGTPEHVFITDDETRLLALLLQVSQIVCPESNEVSMLR